MTAIAEDTSHLAAMARTGLATHMLRILPDEDRDSGLSGNADEGVVLDLIADHLDTPVFRLGQGRYALDAGDEQVDALMRAMPGLCPDTEFTVQAFAPPGEKASETQARVISRIECATEAIQAVLSRLDAPQPCAADPAIAAPLGEEVLELLAERETALLQAVESRLPEHPPATMDSALPETIRTAVREALAEVPAPGTGDAAGPVEELRRAVAALEAGAGGDGQDLNALLDSRIEALESSLRAHLDARLDGLGAVKDTMAETVSAATGGITRWLQDIDGKLASAAPRDEEQEALADRVADLLSRQQTQIAALIDAKLAAQAQTSDPADLTDMLRQLRDSTEASAARLAEDQARLTERLDTVQQQLSDIGVGAPPDLGTVTEAVAGHMVNLETTLSARLDEARPDAETLRTLAEGLREQIAPRLEAGLAEIASTLAADQDSDIRLDEKISALSSALDDRLEAQAARIVASVASQLSQQAHQPHLQASLDALINRVDDLKPELYATAGAAEEAANRQVSVLTAHMDATLKTATDTLAGHLVGAEDLLQARLDAQHSQMAAKLLRELADLGERIEGAVRTSVLPETLVEILDNAQPAGDGPIAEALEQLALRVEALQTVPSEADTGAEMPGADRIAMLERVIEAGFGRLATIEDRLIRGDAASAQPDDTFARLAALIEELGAQPGSSTARIADTEHRLIARIDELHHALSDRLEEEGAATARPMPAESGSTPGAADRLSAEMDPMLRRLDAQIARFEAAELPNPPAAMDVEAAVETLRNTLDTGLARLAAATQDPDPVLEEVCDRLAGLAGRESHAPILAPLSVAMQTMLRRLDAQIARLEEATLPAPLAPRATAEIEAQLRETEARLIERIEQIAPGHVDDAALRALSDRIKQALARTGTGPEDLTRLSSALQSNLSQFERQVSELEARGGDAEIVQDVKLVLAEYLAQMDKRLAAADDLRHSA